MLTSGIFHTFLHNHILSLQVISIAVYSDMTATVMKKGQRCRPFLVLSLVIPKRCIFNFGRFINM